MHRCNGVSDALVNLIAEETEGSGRYITLGELRDKHPDHASEVQGLIDRLYGVEERHASVFLEFKSVAEAIYELKPIDSMDAREMEQRVRDDLSSLGFNTRGLSFGGLF